ncbi:head-tail adaptor protein [Selenomonas ruminantium]|uniref:Head-tail adaptor n=1 Tax=Selenomonas ruminantium TaxID=971 RepID=A0A1I0V5G6_SELRU|nr:head-tail adaptor protein [Selenomonas ruminantium]SFA71502.1 head-tail adaptor [Selenomonas ruminantium]
MYVSLSELRQRVKILRPVTEEDEVGNLIERGRTELATVWAKVLPYATRISDGYAEKVDEVSYRVVIRYREGIQVTDILEWRGKTLIMSAPPYALDGLRKYLVMETKELVEDG